MLLFVGDSGSFVQTGYDKFIYIGGFMGNTYNKRVGKFSTEHQLVNFKEVVETKAFNERGIDISQELGRAGMITFWDSAN